MQTSTELMGGIIATPRISGARDFAMGPPAASRLLDSPGKGAKMMTTPQSVLDPSALATPDSAQTNLDELSPVSSVLDGPSPLYSKLSRRPRLNTRAPLKDSLSFRVGLSSPCLIPHHAYFFPTPPSLHSPSKTVYPWPPELHLD